MNSPLANHHDSRTHAKEVEEYAIGQEKSGLEVLKLAAVVFIGGLAVKFGYTVFETYFGNENADRCNELFVDAVAAGSPTNKLSFTGKNGSEVKCY